MYAGVTSTRLVYLKHIEAVIEVDGRDVSFRIVELDKRFWPKKGGSLHLFKASNGIWISSHELSEVEACGKETLCFEAYMDGSKVVRSFFSREHADAYEARLIQALHEWNDEWKGWAPRPCCGRHDWIVEKRRRQFSASGVEFGEQRICLTCGETGIRYPGGKWLTVLKSKAKARGAA
jgi:hypothetical protein